MFPKWSVLNLFLLLGSGADGRVAEFDLDASSYKAGVCLKGISNVCPPGANPTALAFAPPLPYYIQGAAETMLLVSDDALKIRSYAADAQQCVGTVSGPVYGGPIRDLLPFR